MPFCPGTAVSGASRGAQGLSLRRLFVCLWIAALALQAAAQDSAAATPAPPDAVPHCYWLQLHSRDGVRRLELLHELRNAVLAGDRTGIAAAVTHLEQRADTTRRELRQRLEQLGAQVRYWFWICDAVSVEVPPQVGPPQLLDLPDVWRVLPVQGFATHLRNATGDRFANVDAVQQDPRYVGRGLVLAIIDSGIARLMPSSGQPHRAFRRRGGTGSRLVGTYGVAPIGRTPPPPDDADGHGTAVASVAAAVDWGAPQSDDGFATGADLVTYRVVDTSGIVTDDTLTAAYQQMALDRGRHDIRVANASIAGHPDPSHPQQIALDTTGYFADVLIVTSAGNDGLFPSPAARSQANLGGLCVGSVANDRREVDATSSWGPLPGDGARFWPDLLALGQLWTARHDDENTARLWNGTSFAAPQVAGTAMLVRGADFGMSAIETKCAILHGTEDIAAANPSFDRSRYGLGMLRSDLVVAGLERDRMFRGALVENSVVSRDYRFDLIAGRRYAATLVWARTQPGNQPQDWDNLDLYVYAPDGRLRAASETPRNLYEKVVFEARQTGSYRVQILGTRFTTTSQFNVPFALMFGEDRSGGIQAGSFQTVGIGCQGSGENPSFGHIVPNAGIARFGNDYTRVPFADTPVRFQQVMDHSWLAPTPFLMKRMALRRDQGEANNPTTQVDADIWLGYSSFTASQMRPSFAANINLGPMTLVRSGRIDFPGVVRKAESSSLFDYVIALDTPFSVQTNNNRHLLIDVQQYGNSVGNQAWGVRFDAETWVGGGRVYQFTGNSNIVYEPLSLILSLMEDGLTPSLPLLDPVGNPRPGQTFSYVVRGARPHAQAVLAHGLSRTDWLGVPLPIDLTPYQASGCRLFTDWYALQGIQIEASGLRRIDYPIPNLPSLSGTLFHSQLLILDPAANPAGIAVSGGLRVIVGG